jgi:hypothetical protein
MIEILNSADMGEYLTNTYNETVLFPPDANLLLSDKELVSDRVSVIESVGRSLGRRLHHC